MKQVRPVLALVGFLVAQLLLACSPAPHRALRAATPLPTPTLQPIRLPADDAPHNDLTEWWYYTGHLAAPSGQRYGFEFVIFQIERAGVPVLYASHFAVTDHQRGQFHYDQRTWNREAAPTRFDLGDGTWTLKGDGRSDHFTATMPGYGINLTVTPTKPPALHGGNGIISFGPIGDSYYYSDTRLDVTGTLNDHGDPLPVTGEAWKDRQWGNFLVATDNASGGWDWYSLQLSDGRDLMLFVLRDATAKGTAAYGTLVDADGRAENLAVGAVQVEPTGTWTSPHTGATYPSGWKLRLPKQDLTLTLKPVLLDQELNVGASTGNSYWEGEVTVVGQSGGRNLKGEGYVELTGYAGRGASR